MNAATSADAQYHSGAQQSQQGLSGEDPTTLEGLKAGAAQQASYADQLSKAAQWANAQGDTKSGAAYQDAANAAYYTSVNYSQKAANMTPASSPSNNPSTSDNPFGSGYLGTGESQAGFNQPGPRPNYVAVNGSGLGYAANSALNLDDGTVYAGFGGALPVNPGGNIVLGFILGNTYSSDSRATNTNDFLTGGGSSGGGSLFGIYVGYNHAYGGATAIEIGIATPGLSKTASPGYGAGTGATLPVTTLPGFKH